MGSLGALLFSQSDAVVEFHSEMETDSSCWEMVMEKTTDASAPNKDAPLPPNPHAAPPPLCRAAPSSRTPQKDSPRDGGVGLLGAALWVFRGRRKTKSEVHTDRRRSFAEGRPSFMEPSTTRAIHEERLLSRQADRGTRVSRGGYFDSVASLKKESIPFSSPKKQETEMFEFSTCDMEGFEDGICDVVADAARFAFVQTLHSPFEADANTRQRPKPQITGDSAIGHRMSEDKAREIPVTPVASILEGRHSTELVVNEALDDEDDQMKIQPQRRRTKSRKFFASFSSLFGCLKAKDAPRQRSAFRPSLRFSHRSSHSESSASSESEGQPDSSAYRYHRRHDFMRSMLETQLDAEH